MNQHAFKKFFIIILIIIALFPIQATCGGVPGYSCTSAPDNQGYIYRTVDYKPLSIYILQQIFGVNIPIYYFSTSESEKI